MYIAYDYFQQKRLSYRPIPDWVEVGVKAVYEDQLLISPGILNQTVMTSSWEVNKVFRRSFQVDYIYVNETVIVTVELNSPGYINICMFDYEFDEIVSLEEDELVFRDFGILRVYRCVIELDNAVHTCVFERNTGILLQREAHWKGNFLEGENMGLFSQLIEINLDFSNFETL
jgi:hypothetical protein